MRQRRDLSPVEKEKIRRLYLAGEKLEYIAITVDRDDRTLRKILRRLGLPMRRPPATPAIETHA